MGNSSPAFKLHLTLLLWVYGKNAKRRFEAVVEVKGENIEVKYLFLSTNNYNSLRKDLVITATASVYSTGTSALPCTLIGFFLSFQAL